MVKERQEFFYGVEVSDDVALWFLKRCMNTGLVMLSGEVRWNGVRLWLCSSYAASTMDLTLLVTDGVVCNCIVPSEYGIKGLCPVFGSLLCVYSGLCP